MNSPARLIARHRAAKRGIDRAARTSIDGRQVQTVHGSNCICHRCRRGWSRSTSTHGHPPSEAAAHAQRERCAECGRQVSASIAIAASAAGEIVSRRLRAGPRQW